MRRAERGDGLQSGKPADAVICVHDEIADGKARGFCQNVGGFARPFALPVFVHQARKLAQIARLQRSGAGVADFLGLMQIVEHRRIGLLRFFVLVLEDGAGAAAVAGEEEDEIVLEIVTRVLGHAGRPASTTETSTTPTSTSTTETST